MTVGGTKQQVNVHVLVPKHSVNNESVRLEFRDVVQQVCTNVTDWGKKSI